MDRNCLYYGDNLDVMRSHISDESVDFIYLDPPFNSQVNYNVLFKAPTGEQSKAQIEAFEDTWHWNTKAEDAFEDVIKCSNTTLSELLRSMRIFLGENDMMAYICMMAVRLVELHRVLRSNGSLCLHCDPTASHYLKLLLDGVFGIEYFTNELIWQRSTPKGLAFTRFPSNHDVIFFYRKGSQYCWNTQYQHHRQDYIDKYYSMIDPATNRRFQATSLLNPNKDRPNLTYEFHGYTRVWRWTKPRMLQAEAEGRIYFPPNGGVPREKRFLDEQEGTPVTSVWTDIPPVNSQAQERLGYPTQKPVELLKRLIASSTKEDSIILDPFCGCGTTIHAAEAMGRRWIGIDITHLAISLIERRLKAAFSNKISYDVHGTPKDAAGAKDLWRRDAYQFQWWATSLVDAVPFGGKKKGADNGVDGIIYFRPDGRVVEKAVVSVKGGEHVGVAMVRDLAHVVEREHAKIGVFVTLARPTAPMETEAVKAGAYETAFGKYPKIQIVTIADLISGVRPRIPLVDPSVFRSPAREDTSRIRQAALL